MQVLAIDLGTDMLPAIALGTERAEPGTMERPPRPPTERLLNRGVLARNFGGIGPLEALAAMASFFFAYWLAGWRPWEPLADSGELYRQATTMTMAGIAMAQVGAAFGWRTNRRSGLQEIFHTSGFGPWQWLLLLLWPPLVLGAEEARKAITARRRPA